MDNKHRKNVDVWTNQIRKCQSYEMDTNSKKKNKKQT